MKQARFFTAIVALAVGAAHADNPGAAPPRERWVPIPGQIITGTIENPAAAKTRFIFNHTDALAGHTHKVYKVAARVIVDGDLAWVQRLVGPNIRVHHASTKGFVIVEAQTVDRAIDLAQTLILDPNLGSVELDLEPPRAQRFPTDPAFFGQWSLHNFANPDADVNVVPVWEAGITGSGVTVGVIEFGWQTDHPDLAFNFYPDASMPPSILSSHATSVAGVIAADNDNALGGVGVAYDANISRLIFGLSTETANAFLFRNDLNDIKNNSWGPPDNGRITVMAAVERAAIEEGVRDGRGGLGEIYVWAAGNGGLEDRVDYDPYASNRYTIAIGAIGDENIRADYNELGSSMFAVAHSSGNVRKIFSTTTGDGYTTTFGGTSASAPLAAGVIALMLQANPNLTWRDVQHVIADTAWQVDPNEAGWMINGAGRRVSDHYGFGAIDAQTAVNAATGWTSVVPEITADTGTVAVNTWIPDNDPAGVTIELTMDRVLRLEAVELVLNINTAFVGDLQIELTSPGGTRSILATSRVDPVDDFIGYTFTTLRSWGESSEGTWTLTIYDRRVINDAWWIDARLIGYGTPWIGGCRVDLDGDGSTTIFDVQAFLAAYSAQDPIADFLADGQFDYFDLQVFLNEFAAGCP